MACATSSSSRWWRTTNQSVSNFDYAYVQPIEAAAQAKYAALNDPMKALVPQLSVKGGLMFVGKDTKTLYSTPKDGFLPRFGFAYKLDSKSVVRGGAGLFAGFLGERRGDVIQSGYSQTTTFRHHDQRQRRADPAELGPALLLTPILEPVGNANGKQTFLGNAISFFNPEPECVEAAPLAVRLPARAAGRPGGGGHVRRQLRLRHRDHPEHQRAAGPVPEHRQLAHGRMVANNAFLSGSVANPFAGLLPGTSFNNATIARSQLLRPVPRVR